MCDFQTLFCHEVTKENPVTAQPVQSNDWLAVARGAREGSGSFSALRLEGRWGHIVLCLPQEQGPAAFLKPLATAAEYG